MIFCLPLSAPGILGQRRAMLLPLAHTLLCVVRDEQGALQAQEGMCELLEGCQGCSPVPHTMNNPCLAAVDDPGSQAGIVAAAPVKVAPHCFLFNPKGDSLPASSCFFRSALLFLFKQCI